MEPVKQCPSCGAELASAEVKCAFCGSHIVPVTLSLKDREKMTEFIQTLNMDLKLFRKTVWINLFFRELFTLLLVLLLTILIQPYIQSEWFQKVFMIIFLASGITFGMIFGLRYYSRKMLSYFINIIDPQIKDFLPVIGIPRWQFDFSGNDLLEDEKPNLLGKYLLDRPERKK